MKNSAQQNCESLGIGTLSLICLLVNGNTQDSVYFTDWNC